MTASLAQFEAERHRRFGTTNPERMRIAHWEWMVLDGGDPYPVRQRLGAVEPRHGDPDWCFDRFGMSRTELGDGRVVCVGGEHEDYYDPDFCIYNDVVVLGPGRSVEIYGYPETIFPPTDFHTAVRVGGAILILGCLGYPDRREPAVTPVYRLALDTWRIEPCETSGEAPGWIYRHEAALDPSGRSITLSGGLLVKAKDGDPTELRNLEDYRLHLSDGRWEQLTDRRHWYQAHIERVDGALWSDGLEDFYYFPDEAFRLRRLAYEVLAVPEDEWPKRRLRIQGVEVVLEPGLEDLYVGVRGTLPDAVIATLVEDLCENVRAVIGRACRVKAS